MPCDVALMGRLGACNMLVTSSFFGSLQIVLEYLVTSCDTRALYDVALTEDVGDFGMGRLGACHMLITSSFFESLQIVLEHLVMSCGTRALHDITLTKKRRGLWGVEIVTFHSHIGNKNSWVLVLH